MTRKFVIVASVVLLVALALVGTAGAAVLDSCNEHSIRASGTGSVIGTPDRAQISLAVETENTDVRAAQRENAARMDAVMNAIVAAGIPRDALKTTGYSIYPIYEDVKSPFEQRIRAYRVTNTLTVTLHDVNRTGEVIDIAVANGINQASSIQFMLSDEQAQVLRTDALREAVARTRADAQTVAGALGVSIASVKDVEISGGYAPVLFQNYQYADGAAMKSAAPTPIEPGSITVTATVVITYLIR